MIVLGDSKSVWRLSHGHCILFDHKQYRQKENCCMSPVPQREGKLVM